MSRHLSLVRLVAGTIALLVAGAGVRFTAADTGTNVAGVVWDPAGAPVPGAVVTLLSPRGAIAATTRSDAAGAFRLEAVPAGSYVLSTDLRGFATQRMAVQVEAGPCSS